MTLKDPRVMLEVFRVQQLRGTYSIVSIECRFFFDR